VARGAAESDRVPFPRASRGHGAARAGSFGDVIVVASANGLAGVDVAWEILAGGGSALDAVEAATRVVEDDPDDHTVGYGGYPNLLGQVELDASIMDGTTRRAGAVGALAGYRHAITVARAVMERLPHVLVVGEGAARLAAELGMEREDLLTEEAARVWREGLEGRLLSGSAVADALSHVASLVTDPEQAAGTVDFLACDGDGRLASAVSTSGWAWKYPGRLGDTPVIGAGTYADDRYGAAACTGWGELAIRAGTARSVVAAVAAGSPLAGACDAAMADLALLEDDRSRVLMHLVAIDAAGGHQAVTTAPGAMYAWRAEGMTAAALAPRRVVTPG
jgi:beta-aspartyl-peptidase (threonine type)